MENEEASDLATMTSNPNPLKVSGGYAGKVVDSKHRKRQLKRYVDAVTKPDNSIRAKCSHFS